MSEEKNDLVPPISKIDGMVKASYDYCISNCNFKKIKQELIESNRKSFIAGVNYCRERLVELYNNNQNNKLDFNTIDNEIFGFEKKDLPYYLNMNWCVPDECTGKKDYYKMNNDLFNCYLKNNDDIFILKNRRCHASTYLSIIAISEMMLGKKVLYITPNLNMTGIVLDTFNNNKKTLIEENMFNTENEIKIIERNHRKIVLDNGGSIKLASSHHNLLFEYFDLIIFDEIGYLENVAEAYGELSKIARRKIICTIPISEKSDNYKFVKALYDFDADNNIILKQTYAQETLDYMKRYFTNDDDFKHEILGEW